MLTPIVSHVAEDWKRQWCDWRWKWGSDKKRSGTHHDEGAEQHGLDPLGALMPEWTKRTSDIPTVISYLIIIKHVETPPKQDDAPPEVYSNKSDWFQGFVWRRDASLTDAPHPVKSTLLWIRKRLTTPKGYTNSGLLSRVCVYYYMFFRFNLVNTVDFYIVLKLTFKFEQFHGLI